MEAIKQNQCAMEYIPNDMINEEFCLMAIKENLYTLEYMPEEYKTLGICMRAVKKSALLLEHVPEAYKTREICLHAVRKNGLAIQYISKEKQTEEICLAAIKNNVSSAFYISEENYTEKVSLVTVKKSGYCINFIKNKEPILCLYAFLNDFDLIDTKDIKNGINKFIKDGNKLNNMVFFNTMFYIDEIKELFDEDKYDFINLDLRSLNYLKDYLTKENSNNHFILQNHIDLEILKDVALSNNELIIKKTEKGNINDIHKKIANIIKEK